MIDWSVVTSTLVALAAAWLLIHGLTWLLITIGKRKLQPSFQKADATMDSEPPKQYEATGTQPGGVSYLQIPFAGGATVPVAPKPKRLLGRKTR